MSGTGLQLDPQMEGWISKTDSYKSKLGLNGNFLFLHDKFLTSERKEKKNTENFVELLKNLNFYP